MTSGKIEPLHTRFAKLVKVTAEGCWDWKGSFDRRGGYPLISLFGGQTSRGQRWGMSIAAIAKVLRIDASCVSRICSGKMRIGLRQKFEQILKTQEEACQ